MKVLVTGGSGYVGCHAVRELARQGHDVIVYDNLSTGHAALSAGFPLIVGDIADSGTLRSHLKEVDVVMHFAASAYVGESVANPRKYFRNNVEAALKLMDAVLYAGIRKFVFSSSCAVYGTPTRLPVAESAFMNPINPYGATKCFFEKVLEAYDQSHQLRYVALRYFNAAGAAVNEGIGEFHTPETHVIPLALRAAMHTGPRLQIFGADLPTLDGTCIRDFVHVSDLARAHAKAIEYLSEENQSLTVNLGSGKGTSLKELIAEVKRVVGRTPLYSVVGARPGDPPVLYADASEAERILGWRATYDLRDIVESAYAWELRRDAVLREYRLSSVNQPDKSLECSLQVHSGYSDQIA